MDGPPRIRVGLSAEELRDAVELEQLGRALGLLTKPLGCGRLDIPGR